MLPISSYSWAYANKNDRLEYLRAALNALKEELKEERAARLRILQYLDLKEIEGPVIVPVVPE